MRFENYRAIKTIHYTTETEADIYLRPDTIGLPIDENGNVTGIEADNFVKMVADKSCTVTLTNKSPNNAMVMINATPQTVAPNGTATVTLEAGVPQLVGVFFA